ncbi:AAA domain (dynein-related subfamily) [Pedobacter terrae]|uniref:AAA domain (Dynein-related subfamily) n=1 Tax=Pedobacter terrae TaxID=405671 RepID=A0A1G8D861_9SPHI|nr:AAA family ATPase [Pedobacter terrae]SDH53968.1 AAA domain (dynein-related subfamily) [Pedobacter terrae]
MAKVNEISRNELEDNGAIPLQDYTENIERIAELANHELKLEEGFMERIKSATAHLLIDEPVLKSIVVALISGHLVLQGPPGTGKSSIVRAIAKGLNIGLLPVTAHEEWSSYDIIGRQTLSYNTEGKEEIVPVNGYFTSTVIDCANAISKNFEDEDSPQASWLFIDELNRCHVDRAFGELFSVLGSGIPGPVTLSHQRENNRTLITPRRFRVVGTINSIDKQFVNSLSLAIRRRFTFITIDIPSQRSASNSFEYNSTSDELAIKEFKVVIDAAIIRIASKFNESIDYDTVVEFMTVTAIEEFKKLFELAEMVRYATADSGLPYLPIGTAQLIDVLELFGNYHFSFPEEQLSVLIDWAASSKLAPLFEADTINGGVLENFANNLATPFDERTKSEIKKIAAAGMYFIG